VAASRFHRCRIGSISSVFHLSFHISTPVYLRPCLYSFPHKGSGAPVVLYQGVKDGSLLFYFVEKIHHWSASFPAVFFGESFSSCFGASIDWVRGKKDNRNYVYDSNLPMELVIMKELSQCQQGNCIFFSYPIHRQCRVVLARSVCSYRR
jgi:hypothetical protein